ncbi:Uncharacterised protein [Raoultella terrigena]|uniref:Uncharacterized protein n=1 Tax=Raoultella terrigena TaxID=577 RepID=A0A3P8JG28_RAOTE|nr:Uncharacterised protein [Raoultella terrigena]
MSQDRDVSLLGWGQSNLRIIYVLLILRFN